MLDTIVGLPVHVLVVHGVVVLLPLAAVATMVWAVRGSADPRVGWGIVAADAVVAALTWVARLSGQQLQARLEGLRGAPVAQQHEAIAVLLPFMALALLVSAVLVQGLRSGDVDVPMRLPGLLAGVVALVAIVWTIRTGHSGTESVWGETIRQTRP